MHDLAKIEMALDDPEIGGRGMIPPLRPCSIPALPSLSFPTVKWLPLNPARGPVGAL